jgi:hypothetical protein
MANPIVIIGEDRISVLSSPNFDWGVPGINDRKPSIDKDMLKVSVDCRPVSNSLPEFSHFLVQEPSPDPFSRRNSVESPRIDLMAYALDAEQTRRDQDIDFIDTDPRLYSQTSSGSSVSSLENTESILFTDEEA